MAEYVCTDGPLQGHVYVTESDPPVGGMVTIDLVGIDRASRGPGAIAEAQYEVASPGTGSTPGTMRYVAVTGLYRKPALPLSSSEPSLA